MKIRRTTFIAVGFIAAAIVVLFDHILGIAVGFTLFRILRWMAISVFAVYGLKRKSLTCNVFVGILAGIEFGHDWPSAAIHTQILGEIFLRLVKVIIAPLLFGSLVAGIGGHADIRRLGNLGIKAFVYFEIVSTVALLFGFVAINIAQAGVGITVPNRPAIEASSLAPHSFGELAADIFPENIAKSVAEGRIVQVVVFSILFGLSLAMVAEPKRLTWVAVAGGLTETMFKFTNLAMLFAPVGVFGATAYTVGHSGLTILLPLLKLLTAMYASLTAFALLILLPLALIARIPMKQFLKAVADPIAIGFATASSEAALPRAMEEMEGLGVARETVAFIIPMGYSFNLDGSGLYQSLAFMFVAQASGIHLTFNQQVVALFTLLIASKGTGGVARGSLVVVLGVVQSFRLPTEPLLLLIGIDQLMDMGRTAINVLGNCVATVVIARWENKALLH